MFATANVRDESAYRLSVMFLSLPKQLIFIFWLLIGIRDAFAFLNDFYAVWAGYLAFAKLNIFYFWMQIF